jgi:GNAT superfamily N-acetyltransferase
MSANLADINLRPEGPADEPFLLVLYESTRVDELNAAGFPPDLRASFIKMQFKARQQGYHTTFPRAEFMVIELGGEPVGGMIVDQTEAEIRLVDIALLPAHRGQGIGTARVQRLQAQAAAANLPLCLSVVRGGRAALLYQRLGFTKTGELDWRDLMEWRGRRPPA